MVNTTRTVIPKLSFINYWTFSASTVDGRPKYGIENIVSTPSYCTFVFALESNLSSRMDNWEYFMSSLADYTIGFPMMRKIFWPEMLLQLLLSQLILSHTNTHTHTHTHTPRSFGQWHNTFFKGISNHVSQFWLQQNLWNNLICCFYGCIKSNAPLGGRMYVVLIFMN